MKLKRTEPTPKSLLENLSFVAIDLETTGGNHQSDKIIEIGLVRIERLEIVDEMHFLINPEVPVPQFIQKLTSISPKDLAGAPKIEEVIEDILQFIGSRIVVAHNISFDLPFLNSVLARLRIPELENKSLCTNLMTKYMIPNILSSNLNYMSQIFDIPHDKAHRALEDAKACAHLLLNYLEIFIEKNIRKINQLYYPRSKFELDRAHFKQNEFEDLLALSEKINSPAMLCFKGFNGLQLATIPLENPSLEKEILRRVEQMVDYQNISIYLMGSFFEAFMGFNSHYNKFEPEVKEMITSYLTRRHLGKDELEFNQNQFSEGLDKQNFLITRHLIPGQLLIYPLFNLHTKNELIFRFPGHKKRIFHYVMAHIKRSEQSRKKGFNKHPFHKDLFPFIYEFLEKKKNDKDKFYLFVNKQSAQSDKGKLFNYLNNFNSIQIKSNHYPRVHI